MRKLILFLLALAASGLASAAEVWPGVEVLARERAKEISGKRVGILTNPTGVDRDLVSTVDRVRAIPGVKVVRLFAPEHGVRGGQAAGVAVDEKRDPVSGLPIESLYGKTRRPTREMLDGLDVVLYDIQDVGCRTYTYVSSLTYLMEECEKAGVAVWVLDRPEPMGGKIVGGPVIENDLLSFIGVHRVPLVYGLTPGEWARMIKAERTPKIKLEVIPMKGWKRGTPYGDLGWVWIPPSPHIPRWESCYFYAITGTIGEQGTVSEGVGTPLPFEVIGAPWMDSSRMEREMNALKLPGLLFNATSFKPRYGSYKDEMCQGIQIYIRDARLVDPPRTDMELMAALVRIHPEKNLFREKPAGDQSLFLAALGDRALAKTLAKNADPRTHEERLSKELRAYMQRRKGYLIYE